MFSSDDFTASQARYKISIGMAMVIVTTEEAGFAFMSAILGCG